MAEEHGEKTRVTTFGLPEVAVDGGWTWILSDLKSVSKPERRGGRDVRSRAACRELARARRTRQFSSAAATWWASVRSTAARCSSAAYR